MHAIDAAHCFDGDRFRPGGATVVVEGERIVGVERRGHPLPEGVPRTAYAGTVLPGLVDCHVHLVGEPVPGGLERAGILDDDALDARIATSLREQAAHGVTTVRDLGDRGYRTLAFRDDPAPGAPRVLAAGPPLTVPDGHCHYLGGGVTGADGIRRAVAERAERGVDVVKIMATGGMVTPGTDINAVQFTAEELRLAVDLAHAAGLRVTCHAHGLAGQWQALEAGTDGLEHFSCFTEQGPHCPDELLEAVAAAGVTVCPTIGLDVSRLPPIEQAPPAVRELAEKFGLFPERLREVRSEQLSRIRAAGIRLVTGVDAGASAPKWHGMAARSALDLLYAGYPIAEALATATSLAADDCGLSGVTGRLAPGRAADLLVVDGDLEHDPEALARPLAVAVRGVDVRPAVDVGVTPDAH